MCKKWSLTLFLSLSLSIIYAQLQKSSEILYRTVTIDDVRVGAERTELYFPMLQNKRVAVVVNHTATIGETHLVDSLLDAGINLKRIFAPEHGFRGTADAGEHIDSYTDEKTGLAVVSLYGRNFKPRAEDLADIDIVIFDIQDVGARFYTYISTMHYVMEACAENDIHFIVLDRPNPNGFYVDGPVLKPEFKSFVGMHPVPIVHGMTIAEYALMINGEGWLKNGIQCNLSYVRVENYNHTYYYQLPIRPSPNLPNMKAIYLYPSLCLFEGTTVSLGRGTDKPFQVIGHPKITSGTYSFTPRSMPGAQNPPHLGKKCYGFDLSDFGKVFMKNYKKIYLHWLIELYNELSGHDNFFNNFFDRLAGTDLLRKQIIDGLSAEEIRATWQNDINQFKKIRKKHLLYPDFE